MRKLILLLLCSLFLTGCTTDRTDLLAPAIDAGATIPQPDPNEVPAGQTLATLWFRFGTEPLLAAERRIITTTPTVSEERALLEMLIAGPASGELGALFPQGTHVLATHREGRMLFVTLSKEIMNGFADEPDSWKNDPYWAVEAPLRRELAMQSIVATVTENHDVDTVVILVEQGNTVTDSLRLRQGYYLTSGDAKRLADPLTRNEELLLTPTRTAEVILQCWQERDFIRLCKYLSEDVAEADFAADMAGLPHLVAWTLSGGSVQGSQAVFTVNSVSPDGSFAHRILRLKKVDGLWRIAPDAFAAWKEATP